MNLAVLQLKGGVGKTPLSFSLAKDLDLNWQSNDDSVVPQFYKKGKILDRCEIATDTIYDFGGFASAGVLEILKQCDFIIVPITPNPNSIKKAASTISQIKPLGRKIIGVVTNISSQKELDETVATIKAVNIICSKFFILKSSRIFENAMTNGLSFLELYNESSLAKRQYQSFIDMYQKIIDYIKDSVNNGEIRIGSLKQRDR
ncbi:hypothetical protein [uncultured Campylobacter sp.]|jgi:MinD-like ATPase involved in chromosome partitioning or flagellar assembly|uniref:hypothetical protein n=1 Tax=uncultured Campylobacter sp. TaxID=218934 RepID=UPI00261637D4|nr:hypothetical protein [uncultured Campylobacter sp.]